MSPEVKRAVETREPIEPVIDLPSVVQGAIRGDEESIRQLDGVLRRRLMPFFVGKNPNEAEDWTEDTVIKVLNALPKFRGEGDNYSNIFWGWIRVIATNQYFEQYRKSRRHRFLEVPLAESMQGLPIEQPGSDMKYDITEETVLNVIKDKFRYLLSPLQLRAVEERIAGKSDKEMALEDQVEEVAIRARIFRARRKIEKEILQPADFKRVSSFNEGALINAACEGRLKTIKILGKYYTREEDVRAYKERCRPNQSLIDVGYVLLAEGAKAQEYMSLASSSKVLKSNGRLYIKRSDLEECRRIPRRKRTFSPTPSHERATELCSSLAEQERMYKAIKRGRLNAKKYREVWFVIKDEFDAWRSSNQNQEKALH